MEERVDERRMGAKKKEKLVEMTERRQGKSHKAKSSRRKWKDSKEEIIRLGNGLV